MKKVSVHDLRGQNCALEGGDRNAILLEFVTPPPEKFGGEEQGPCTFGPVGAAPARTGSVEGPYPSTPTSTPASKVVGPRSLRELQESGPIPALRPRTLIPGAVRIGHSTEELHFPRHQRDVNQPIRSIRS